MNRWTAKAVRNYKNKRILKMGNGNFQKLVKFVINEFPYKYFYSPKLSKISAVLGVIDLLHQTKEKYSSLMAIEKYEKYLDILPEAGIHSTEELMKIHSFIFLLAEKLAGRAAKESIFDDEKFKVLEEENFNLVLLKYGYYSGNEDSTTTIKLKSNNPEKFKKFLAEEIKKKYGKFLQLRFKTKDIELESLELKCIDTAQSKKYSNKIIRFLKAGKGKSLLVYGPPGTGKSNLIKTIAKDIDERALIISNPKEFCFNTEFIYLLIDILSIKVILFDDIDHWEKADLTPFLQILEYLHEKGIAFLSTANNVSKLDPALIRPGRFDELVELNKLEPEAVMTMVNGDSQLFEICKDYPVAFISELMERIEILGRKEALESLEDIKLRAEAKNEIM